MSKENVFRAWELLHEAPWKYCYRHQDRPTDPSDTRHSGFSWDGVWYVAPEDGYLVYGDGRNALTSFRVRHLQSTIKAERGELPVLSFLVDCINEMPTLTLNGEVKTYEEAADLILNQVLSSIVGGKKGVASSA